MSELTSKERMLRALRREVPDYIPCSFMGFTALRRQCREDPYQLVISERAMGLDSFFLIPTTPRPHRVDHPDLPGLPVHFSPEVEVKEWREEASGGAILHKDYATPAGKLSTGVRLSDDWPHGNHIPFVDDYQIACGLEPLITEIKELEALRFLLTSPQGEDIMNFQEEAEKADAFAEDQGVLLAGGWGVGADMANWLCGIENFKRMTNDQPDFATALLDTIYEWNIQRMSVVLSAPVDLFMKRAWFEGCDFLSPAFFREVMLSKLKTEVGLAHENGALFGYVCPSGTLPMLDFYLEAGVDVLIGVDPVQGAYTSTEEMKKQAGAQLSFWGGVSGAVTVEQGSEDDVRTAVQKAIETLGPRGFILSPAVDTTIDDRRVWHNVDVFIDEWKIRRNVFAGEQ